MGPLRECAVIGMVVLWMSWTMGLVQAQSLESESPWQFSVRVGGQYSDSRDGTKTNKQSNLDGIVEPSAAFLYQDADRTSLRLTLTPVLKWRSNPRTANEGSKQNDAEFFGSAGLELMHYLTPTIKLSAGDLIIYNDDLQFIENGATLRRSENYVLNTVHAGVDAALTAETGLGLTAKRVTTHYQDGSVSKELNSSQFNGDVTPYYVVGSGLTLFGQVGVAKFQETKTNSCEYVLMTYNAGIEKKITPDIVGKIMGGYQVVNYENPALESANIMNSSAELVFQASAPTRFRLGASYGYEPPRVRFYSAQKATTISGAVDHNVLADRLIVGLQGQYTDCQYMREGVTAPGGSEKMTRITVRGTYYLNKRWSLTGGYSFENWDSTVRESYSCDYVDVSVRAEL